MSSKGTYAFRVAASMLVACGAVLQPAAAHSGEIKISGATTVAFGLVMPQRQIIERLSGREITVLPSSTIHGLGDLASGRADIAMLAEPLASAAAVLNRKSPGSVEASQLVERHVGDAYVQFIVHPSNPLLSLSRAQLADLYSGKVKNWAEFGGNNQPVLVVVEPTSSPFHLIRDALAISYTPDLRVVQNTNQTAIVVAQAPGAISNISTAHDVPERSRFKVLDTDVKLPLHLYLAYRKDASPDVVSVAEAAITAAKP
ncbi:substrate-binding domain-containing protein [Bradyrhizobium sp. 199]|uniref:substrate-binding domain-containing protein n=1 Tax=Bradyrhizobium sp. 199 TaxID=2782664 RepID=UPI001FF8560C|nr:substrate-binding domain-containing protein [Bradyrhizobium sp. 199]MCK1358522.1 substrate-binding domain-containing protein [Bradyrhizobium sp. 199]